MNPVLAMTRIRSSWSAALDPNTVGFSRLLRPFLYQLLAFPIIAATPCALLMGMDVLLEQEISDSPEGLSLISCWAGSELLFSALRHQHIQRMGRPVLGPALAVLASGRGFASCGDFKTDMGALEHKEAEGG
jgi:hypothetical protein